MTERDRTAIDVDLVAIELEIADVFLGHDREGLVDLEQVDVVDAEACPRQHLARRRHRSVQHQGRRVPHIGHRDHAGARLEAMRPGIIRRSQQDRRRAVDHAGRVSGMMHEVDVEIGIFRQDELAVGRSPVVDRVVGDRRKGRLQAGQTLHRGLRPRIFLAIEREAAVLAINRNEALLEITARDRLRGALLAFETERVDVLPGDAFERCHGVGAHPLMRLRVPGAQAQIAVVHHERPLAATAFHRHHFGTAGDDEILGARHDRGRRHVDAGDPGAAETIERDAAGAHVIAGVERRHPPQIAALRTALGAGAPDDVVDIGGIDAGALGQRTKHRCAELLRVNARQRPLAGLANAARRPAGIDDQCVNHVSVLVSLPHG